MLRKIINHDAAEGFENAKQDEPYLKGNTLAKSQQEKAVVNEIWYYANPNK